MAFIQKSKVLRKTKTSQDKMIDLIVQDISELSGVVSGNDELKEILANGFTTGPNDISIDNGQKIISTGPIGAGSYIHFYDYISRGHGIQLQTLNGGINIAEEYVDMNCYHADATLGLYTSNAGLEIYNSVSQIYYYAGSSFFVMDGVLDIVQIEGPNGIEMSGDVDIQTGYTLSFAKSAFVNTIDTLALTADRTINFQDASGTVAFMSDIAANNELSEILANGNTTGGTDISVDDTDDILFGSGGAKIHGDANSLVITSPTGRSTYIIDGTNQWSYGGGVMSIVNTGAGQFNINASTTDVQLDFINANNSGFTGTLASPALTNNRVWRLPVDAGTLVLDWETTLAVALTNGNTTGANDIIVSAGQAIHWTDGAFTNRIISDTLTISNKSHTLQNVSGTIAHLADIVADTNFATSNLTFTGSRTHTTNGNTYLIRTHATNNTEGWSRMGTTWLEQGLGNTSLYIADDDIQLRVDATSIPMVKVSHWGVEINSTKTQDGIFKVHGDITGNLIYGNSYADQVSICHSGANANFSVGQENKSVGTVSNGAGGTTVTGVGTKFLNTFKIGDSVTIVGETVVISAIASDTSMTTAAITGANAAVTYTIVGFGTRFQVHGNGNVGIGLTPQARLDILAPGTTASDIAFNVRNNGDTANMVSITGQGAIVQVTATAPTIAVTDGYHQYSSDVEAGNAGPTFRTESGDIIKLFTAAALTAADATATDASIATNDTITNNLRVRIDELEDILQANGLVA